MAEIRCRGRCGHRDVRWAARPREKAGERGSVHAPADGGRLILGPQRVGRRGAEAEVGRKVVCHGQRWQRSTEFNAVCPMRDPRRSSNGWTTHRRCHRNTFEALHTAWEPHECIFYKEHRARAERVDVVRRANAVIEARSPAVPHRERAPLGGLEQRLHSLGGELSLRFARWALALNGRANERYFMKWLVGRGGRGRTAVRRLLRIASRDRGVKGRRVLARLTRWYPVVGPPKLCEGDDVRRCPRLFEPRYGEGDPHDDLLVVPAGDDTRGGARGGRVIRPTKDAQ